MAASPSPSLSAPAPAASSAAASSASSASTASSAAACPAAAPPAAFIDDPGFAPFADLAGMLDLALRAEHRLRFHLDHRHPNSGDIANTESVIISLWRLTAIRKSLMDSYKSARAPLPPKKSPSGASPSVSDAESISPAQTANPSNESKVSPRTEPASLPLPAANRSVPSCPTIPASQKIDNALAAVDADLDVLERAASAIAVRIAPDSQQSPPQTAPPQPSPSAAAARAQNPVPLVESRSGISPALAAALAASKIRLPNSAAPP